MAYSKSSHCSNIQVSGFICESSYTVVIYKVLALYFQKIMEVALVGINWRQPSLVSNHGELTWLPSSTSSTESDHMLEKVKASC